VAEPSAVTSHGKSAAPPAPEPFTKSLERMNYFQEPEARALIADLALPPGSSGLDTGCGVGLYALWLAEAVGLRGRVLGIEPTAERVEAARELVGKRLDAGRLEFREGDATALGMKDGSLDWVWCGDVLHHVLDTDKALSEFRRVVRPGGRVVIKESQVLSAMFLPGYPDLERRIQLAEIARSLDEGGGRSFQERRQTTLASLRTAGLSDIVARTYLIERRAPLTAAAREYIQNTVFDRNWGDRLRPLLSAEDWWLRMAVCEPGSPRNVLASPDYYCLYPVTVFAARVPER
jgi:SAM-dependent methyltransferase